MDTPKPKIGVGFGVMLMRDAAGVKEILLGKRNDDPEKASSALHGEGTWTMPGGKLDYGERFEQGAARELVEETSIVAAESAMKVITLQNIIISDAHFVTIGMLCTDFQGEAKVMEPDEITEWQWFSLENLPEKMFFPSKNIIERYQQGKFYLL